MNANPPTVSPGLQKRFRLAGALLAIGLLIEGTTLFSSTATAFLTFALAGATLVALGALVYLYALFSE